MSEEHGERSVSAVAARSGLTRTHGAIALVGVTVVLLGVVFVRGAAQHEKPPPKDTGLLVQATARYEPAPNPQPVVFRPPQMTVAPPSPAPPSPVSAPAETTPQADPMRQARHASLLAYGAIGGTAKPEAGAPGPGAQAVGAGARQTDLGARLVPTRVTAVSASVLPHQPYLLTRGTQIQCILLTAIDSTLPGPISCKLPNDVIGKTGLTLLDRGTIITGETGGSMTQGQNRLFALWSRAETPQGVIINLDSPGADPLGRAGFEGSVETHAGARILNSVLLALASGGLQAAASMASSSGVSMMSTGGTSGAVVDALQGSVNIRPTLRMNQGDAVSISVVRDLSFEDVYSLSVRN